MHSSKQRGRHRSTRQRKATAELIPIVLVLLVVAVPRPSAGAAHDVDADSQTITLLHEGSLAGNDGLPMPDGDYTLTFSVWTAERGGELLLRETRRAVVVRDGSYHVELEVAVPAGFDVSNLWIDRLLELAVTPRTSPVLAGEARPATNTNRLPSHAFVTNIGDNAIQAGWFEIPQSDGGLMLLNGGGLTRFGSDIYFATGSTSAFLRLVILEDGEVQVWKRLQVSGSDANLTQADSGHLQVGDATGPNLLLDDNEIMARNNGSASTLYLQHEGGDVHVNGNVVHTSDVRTKENVRPLEAGLSEVLRLRPVSYERVGPAEREQLGLIAQDVRQVIEEVVFEEADGTLGIAYSALVPVLIKAIQDQQAEIAELRKFLAAPDASLVSETSSTRHGDADE